VVAGDAVAWGSVDGAGSSARFNTPSGIAVDAAGNLYVADQFNNAIRKITPDGQVSTFAGALGTGGQVDGIGGAARLTRPVGLCIDATGNLYVTDSAKIRKISPSGLVTTVATIEFGATGVAVDATGVAVDATGSLYVTTAIDTRKITADGTTIVEGSATTGSGFENRFLLPRGVAADSNGTVYVADLYNAIRRLGPDGKLAPFVGTPGVTGSTDGVGAAASFDRVFAMATDTNGNIYAANAYDYLIRKITPAGVVSTLAGTRGSDTLQAGPLPGSLARVSGIAVARDGTLFATSGNAVIKVVPSP
jgi:sugar lactone lactonase YvrE